MGSKRPYFRSYPYRRYNQLILVSFDSSERIFSENGWCGGVTGVHHVELTPYPKHNRRVKVTAYPR